jgi:hypothetical protein
MTRTSGSEKIAPAPACALESKKPRLSGSRESGTIPAGGASLRRFRNQVMYEFGSSKDDSKGAVRFDAN